MLAYDYTAMKPPQGGHRFHWRNVSFSAESFDALVEKLAEFRRNNRLPLDDPQQEVLRYYADFAPHLVMEVAERSKARDRQRAAESVMAISYGRFELLARNDEQVAARLAVCAGCPQRRADFEEPVTKYWNEAESVAARLTGELEPMRAGHCGRFGWLNVLGARLQDPAKLALEEKPDFCWLSRA